MTLTAPVVAVREVPAGTPVGYGHAWRAPRRTTLALVPLALVPIGYADVFPRAAAPGEQVLVRGERRSVVGRMSMDQLVVDVGEAGVVPGDVVTVFGPGDAGEPIAADWARWAGTIEHEIVTGVGSRVRRKPREVAS